jgi:hypothetical protein
MASARDGYEPDAATPRSADTAGASAGVINTPAVEKTLGDVEARIAKLPPEGVTRYGAMWRTFTRRVYTMEREGSRRRWSRGWCSRR